MSRRGGESEVEVELPGSLQPGDLDYAKAGGLVPGVVQHADTGAVLMVGFLDQEALTITLQTGLATFHSRSRRTLWTKGETSGNTLRVTSIDVDCDRDTLLLHAIPAGPTCHTGSETCFTPGEPTQPAPGAPVAADRQPERSGVGRDVVADTGAFLTQLDTLIASRHDELPEGSYTTSLFTGGIRRIAQKVGEEGVETALAAVAQEDEELLGEGADLIYHLLVLLRARGLGLGDVERVLRERHG